MIKLNFSLVLLVLVIIFSNFQTINKDGIEFYKEINSAICNKDIELIKKYCEQEAYNSFLGRYSKETQKAILNNYCNREFKIKYISENEFKVFVGKEDVKKSLYTSAFLIKYTNESWKIIKFYAAK